ncbi:UDP-N-acetylglucosamine 2-epimerase (non-hydrolyzing) [Candidatus Marinamargulisbacteria bacterium SCGC AG-343-K17]|nr:UDP-N-acetylglucosamine 2-epimerase (non-hydrolyzing) [Candidatus Marinamargulisbacteria bacterium SCGC AG-343-K17]
MILICFGTRPEYIKIQPLLNQFDGKIPYKTLFTGQHLDLVDTSVDYQLAIPNGKKRMDDTVQACLATTDDVFDGITHVLVQGDTSSAFGMALAGFHRQKTIIHLEAGLRTYDLTQPYPEEGYRQAISRLTKIHLCPTEQNAQNLRNEHTQGHILVVGNTVLDHLNHVIPSDGHNVLVTMHRRENHQNLADWFDAINSLAKSKPDLMFELPIHPNPNVIKHRERLTNVQVIEPLEYSTMIEKIASSKLIISDSGGIQEEASFLNKKVIVCRQKTERIESLNTHSFLCPTPQELASTFNSVINKPNLNTSCPYGDGHAAEKIMTYLTANLFKE